MVVRTKTMVFWSVKIHSLVNRYESFLLHGKEEDSTSYRESRSGIKNAWVGTSLWNYTASHPRLYSL